MVKKKIPNPKRPEKTEMVMIVLAIHFAEFMESAKKFQPSESLTRVTERIYELEVSFIPWEIFVPDGACPEAKLVVVS